MEPAEVARALAIKDIEQAGRVLREHATDRSVALAIQSLAAASFWLNKIVTKEAA